MKRHRVAAAIAAAALLPTIPAAAQSSGRDRVCLEGLLDAYVDAVIAHDPQRLPLDPAVKFTENGQRLALGDGLWHTATGNGGYGLKLADLERGQAVLMGTIREADTPPPAAWYAPVPPTERLSRAALVEIANKYFTGIERNDGRGDYPLAENCARLENGLVLAGDVALVSPHANGRPNGGQVGRLEQFRSGVFFYVTRIRDRRFVLVDSERGLVFAFAFFDNAGGESRFGTLPDGRRVESGPKIPWTWQIAEVFKIERGLIGPVESVLQQAPYGMGSGWSTWQEPQSSEPRG